LWRRATKKNIEGHRGTNKNLFSLFFFVLAGWRIPASGADMPGPSFPQYLRVMKRPFARRQLQKEEIRLRGVPSSHPSLGFVYFLSFSQTSLRWRKKLYRPGSKSGSRWLQV